MAEALLDPMFWRYATAAGAYLSLMTVVVLLLACAREAITVRQTVLAVLLSLLPVVGPTLVAAWLVPERVTA